MHHVPTRMLLVAALAVPVWAFATGQQQYAVLRDQHPPVTVSAISGMDARNSLSPGAVFEVVGVVQQVVDDSASAFDLVVYNGESLRFSVPQPDADIAAGVPLKVLGKVNDNGSYTSLAVMRIDGEQTPALIPSSPAPVVAVNTSTTRNVVPANTPAQEVKPTQVFATPKSTPITAVTSARTKSEPVHAKSLRKSVPSAPVKKPAPPKKPSASPAPVRHTAAASPAKQLAVFTTVIRQTNRSIGADAARRIAAVILKRSPRYGLDPRLVLSVIRHESGFNPRAISPVGAIGLGQLMPGTAAQLGIINPFDIAQNVEGAIRYLAAQLKRFKGNVDYALAAYNAGPGNVLRFNGIPPFQETQQYVRQISAHYNTLRMMAI